MYLRIDPESGIDGLFEPMEFSGIEICGQIAIDIGQSILVRIELLPVAQKPEDGDDGIKFQFDTAYQLNGVNPGGQFRSVREEFG